MNSKEYKRKLKDSLIKYRNSLNLPSSVTFGIEIEYENIIKDTVSYLLLEQAYYDQNYKGWINKSEFDIYECNSLGEALNGEINSPILKDDLISWKNLKTTLGILNRNGAITTEKCGGHVNIGAQIFKGNQEYLRNFILLWTLYNNEIYKFSSGEYNTVRKNLNNRIENTAILFKKQIDNILYYEDSFLDYVRKIMRIIKDKRHDLYLGKITSSIFKNNNVVEFRVPNGTLSCEIWQNYINFFTKFILACKKDLDIEKILYKINNNEHDIIELANFTFDNELDKEYFFIQALKTNKVYKKELPKHLHF